MKKTISMIAIAAISFGSVNAFAEMPVQTQQRDTSKMKKPMKKKMKHKKMMKDTMMKKDTAMKM